MTDRQKETKEVKSSLVKREFSQLSDIKREFSQEQKEFVLKTIAPTLDQNELLLFLYRSQKLGLNPLEGEIFAYSSTQTIAGEKIRQMVMIVSRDGKRRVAFQTGHLKRIDIEAIYVKKTFKREEAGKAEALETEEIKRVAPWEGGILWGATCTISRDDYEKPFTVTVPFKEYNKGKSVWLGKPETMIKKVAESQCLSLAFPDELGGVYDESERFDEEESPTQVEGGSEPAKDDQITTIKSLGGIVTEGMTKQEAADTIRELSKKGKK
jgi:phage recombination protein Bet